MTNPRVVPTQSDLVLAAYKSGRHVVLRWFDRTYNGQITYVDDEGFRLSNPDDRGVWSGWDADYHIEDPWWTIATDEERREGTADDVTKDPS